MPPAPPPNPSDPTRSKERAGQRALHRSRCIPDPTRPGKRINPEHDTPHGTVSGHDNWGCQCRVVRPWHLLTTPNQPANLLDPPRDDEPPGCEPVAVAADRARRRRRRCRQRGCPTRNSTATPRDLHGD